MFDPSEEHTIVGHVNVEDFLVECIHFAHVSFEITKVKES